MNNPDNLTNIKQHSDYIEWKAYGASGALQVQATQLNNHEPTILLETAKLLESSGNERSYNWNQKTSFRLTLRELPELAALGLGYIKQCQFRRGDKLNYKDIRFERQEKQIYVYSTTNETGSAVSVPVLSSDWLHINFIILKQLTEHAHGLDKSMLLASIRGAYI